MGTSLFQGRWLYRRRESENGKEIRFLMVVPKSLRQLHDSTAGAHLGMGKLYVKLGITSFGTQ